MKRILALTYFSICANVASEFALELARLSKARIDFLHLFSSPVDWVKLPIYKERNYPEIQKQIRRAKGELLKWINKASEVKVEGAQSLVFSIIREEVFIHIKNHSCDLILMGSHGTNGLKEFIMGSNAQQILRNANIPVLIVKNRIDKLIKKILIVSNFKDVSQTAFHTITRFADVVGAHIELLFVNSPNEFTQSKETDDNMERVLAHSNSSDARIKNVFNAITVEQGIKDFSDSHPIDLIAICIHEKSQLLQLLSPSITEKITNHTLLPLLSIKL